MKQLESLWKETKEKFDKLEKALIDLALENPVLWASGS